MYSYSIYGITVSAPFPCKVLPLAAPQAVADVVIVDGEVATRLDAPLVEGPMWQSEAGRFLFRGGRRAGRFLAEGGNRVTLQRAPTSEDDVLELAFLDFVLVALLRQRGNLVLHATTALTPKGAIALSGQSGAGKSTILTALLQQGCRMLADDTTVLQLDGQRKVEVLPGIPQMNLMEDTALSLDYDISRFPRHQWRRAKAIVPTRKQMSPHSALLGALYLLEENDVEDVVVRSLIGTEKFSAVQTSVFGPMFPDEHPAAFPLFATLVEQVPVFRIQRPRKRWTVSDVVQVLLA